MKTIMKIVIIWIALEEVRLRQQAEERIRQLEAELNRLRGQSQ